MGEIRHVLHAGIREVTPGDLSRAFEEVTDHRPARQPVPVVERPVEFVRERCQEERRVGNPAADDHVRAARKRRQDGFDTQVRVRRYDPAVFAERPPRFERDHLRLHAPEDVVAGDCRDFHAQAEAACHGDHDLACPERIGRAHIRHDAHAVARDEWQQRLHSRLEQRVEAGAGRLALAQLGGGDRPLGEALENQVVEAALGGEHDRRLDAITLESGACADTNGLCF